MSQLRHGRPEAAAAIWTWRAPERAPGADAGAARARRRGLLQAAAGLAVGTAIFTLASRTLGGIVLSIATAIGLAAALSPQGLFAAVERAFAALGRALGRALTWVLLPAIFFGFFAPFAALFRRGRRDAMKRFFDPDARSYWKPRETPAAASASPLERYRP